MVLKNKKRLAQENEHKEKPEDVNAPVSTAEEKIDAGFLRPAGEKRTRLSCDISQIRHRQLKIFAAETERTIVEVVEDLIERNCARQR